MKSNPFSRFCRWLSNLFSAKNNKRLVKEESSMSYENYRQKKLGLGKTEDQIMRGWFFVAESERSAGKVNIYKRMREEYVNHPSTKQLNQQPPRFPEAGELDLLPLDSPLSSDSSRYGVLWQRRQGSPSLSSVSSPSSAREKAEGRLLLNLSGSFSDGGGELTSEAVTPPSSVRTDDGRDTTYFQIKTPPPSRPSTPRSNSPIQHADGYSANYYEIKTPVSFAPSTPRLIEPTIAAKKSPPPLFHDSTDHQARITPEMQRFLETDRRAAIRHRMAWADVETHRERHAIKRVGGGFSLRP